MHVRSVRPKLCKKTPATVLKILRTGQGVASERMSDSEATNLVAVPEAKAKGPVSDRTKNTLFIRNLPFTATNQDLETFFSEYGPIKSCFVVMEQSPRANKTSTDAGAEGEPPEEEPKADQKNKGFGFVHFALDVDAGKALDALKTAKFQGRKLKGELAMRKHVKFDRTILAEELPKAHHASTKLKGIAPQKPVPTRPTNMVEIFFKPESGQKALDFSKKQLYKKVRKMGNLVNLEYPAQDHQDRAVASFGSYEEAERAVKKLDKHIFKGLKMECKMIRTSADGKLGGSSGPKAHRLIVRNLPFKIEPHALDEQFGSFGKILEIVLPTKPGSAQLKGFAFVQFEQKESAVLAMAAINGKDIMGRPVAVDWAIGKTLYEQISKTEQEEIAKAQAHDEGSDAEDDGSELGEMGIDDDEEVDEDVDMDIDNDNYEEKSSGPLTVFIRNIGFETSEAALLEKFSSRFGPVEYCKLVVNPETGVSRGTAFIKFREASSADAAINASQLLSQDAVASTSAFNAKEPAMDLDELKRKRAGKAFKSLLVDNDAVVEDTEQGGILLDGRALSVVMAVERDEAKKLKLVEAAQKTDKRRLGLLQESVIKPGNSLAGKFWSEEDKKERQAMVKSRLADLRKNANSIVSEVRLSVRHLPTAVDEPHLKQVIEHVLGEALRSVDQVLEDQPVHRENAVRGKPRLKQVKIVRSTGEDKESRAGRSKGFGFVEFTQPSHALLVLRYMTNYAPDAWHKQLPEIFGRRAKQVPGGKKGAETKPMVPVVEFAIDKIAVLEKSGTVEPGKRQIHKKHLPRPTGKTASAKRPGFNQGNKKTGGAKRQKK